MSGKAPGSLARAKAALESDLLRTSLELRRASEEYEALEAAFRVSAERLREASGSISALRDEEGVVRRAATVLKAERDELRRVTASLFEERASLHRERATLREGLVAARTVTADLEARLARAWQERDDANARLAEVCATRAWRLANLYWRTLRRLGLLPAEAEAASMPAPLPAPAPAPEPPSAVPEASAEEEPAPASRFEEDPIPAPRAIPGPPAPVEPPPRTFGAPRDAAVPGLPDIVCFSIVEWEFLFQRPQQLLSRLADRGHRVWYVSQFFEPVPGAPSVHRLRSRVSTLRLRGSGRHLFSEELPADEADAVFASLSSLRDAERISSAVSFVHQPFWWPLAERARRAFGWKVLYDCMDDHGGFQTNARPVDGPERGILEDADAVVTTARALEARLRSAGRPVELVPNGCDFEYFSSIAPRARAGRPTVGYYGCIADWFDSDLVADVAAKRPDCDAASRPAERDVPRARPVRAAPRADRAVRRLPPPVPPFAPHGRRQPRQGLRDHGDGAAARLRAPPRARAVRRPRPLRERRGGAREADRGRPRGGRPGPRGPAARLRPAELLGRPRAGLRAARRLSRGRGGSRRSRAGTRERLTSRKRPPEGLEGTGAGSAGPAPPALS